MYSIIYADPPWRYNDPKNNDPAMGGITYPTMSDDEICSLPIEKISNKDAGLFLWATMPKLPEALRVIASWGFRYITCAFVWIKQNPATNLQQVAIWYPGDKDAYNLYSGLGHWVNGNAELVLFGKRGTPSRQNKDVKQIVLAPRSRHSAKPPEVRDRIVSLMGDLPRIELFAREITPGWDVWGNEVESSIKLTETT